MKNHRILSCLLGLMAALAVPCGCEPDDLLTQFDTPEEQALRWADMPLSIATEDAGQEATKASLLTDVELRGSGALVLVYRSATRLLESSRFFTQAELAGQAAAPLSLRVPLTDCDFYILGNLNAIRRADGVAVNLMDALGPAFPLEEHALEAMVYRLDGGVLDEKYRRESFADVAACGIPYVLVRKDVNVQERVGAGLGIPDSDRCRRLFSKVTVRIDHGAFDGGGAHPEFFQNTHLYLRQVNARLQPFSQDPQRALESADILAQGDYDPDMRAANASVSTFSFYVPENMQGTLLPGNVDSRRKTRDVLLSNGLGGVEPFLTYVEFAGRLNPAAGGYGGDVTYRFYPGRDNCSNFDLERGREYGISLSFRLGSIFEPDWQVRLDNWTDGRLFRLTADAAFTTDIGSVNGARMLAVRKNRPGALYVYMNPQGSMGSTNLLLGRGVGASRSFIPADLSDCAWYGDLMVAGSEDAAWLAARGITPSWDPATGCLRLTVTDAALFDAHLGDAPREFSLSLLPGGTLSTSFLVGLYADMGVSVANGKSLTDEFYVGQKRTVRVSGFAGHSLRYAAVQPGCGDASSTNALQNQNRQWKTSQSAAAGFPSCAVDAAGRPVLDIADPAYATQNYTGSLDVYAFYPNRFQASHAGWSSKPGKIVFFSEDYLNDSMEVEVRVSEPVLSLWAPAGTSMPWNGKGSTALHGRVENGSQYAPVILNMDGNELSFPSVFRSFDGQNVLERSSFEDELFRQLLAFRVGSGQPVAAGSAWRMDAVGTDGCGSLYIARTLIDGHDLFTEDCDRSGTRIQEDQVTLGTLVLQPNPATGLYSQTSEFWVAATRLSQLTIQADSTNMVSGWHKSGSAYESHYFMLLEDASGQVATNRIAMNISAPFRGGDSSRLTYDFSGERITYTVGSHVVEPVYEYEWTDETHFKWIYDAANQVSSYNGQFVPGELLVPYGDQTFSIRYENKWDHRSVVVSKSVTLKYYPAIYTLYAFNPSAGKVFVTGHRNADLLARHGAQMSHACREFCLKVVGVNFGEHFHLNPAQGYDVSNVSWSPLPATARGQYSQTAPLRTVGNFNGAAVPVALYRASGLSAWTESASRDMVFATAVSGSSTPTWRYLLNWGGFGDLKTKNVYNDVKAYQWEDLGFENKFGTFGYGSIYRYSSSNIEAYLNPSYSKVYSTSSITVGYLDSIRYYLWLGSQSW